MLELGGTRLGVCLLTAVLAVGCAGSPYGPLAVIHAEDGLTPQVGGGEGRLEIGACVTLVAKERRLGLVWPDGTTQWNAVTGQIIFRDLAFGDVTLSNGDYITIGGEHFEADRAGGGRDPGEPAPMSWVAPPGTCATDFIVHEVAHLDPPEEASPS